MCATDSFPSLVSTGLNSKMLNVLCEALTSPNCELVDLRLGSNLICNRGAAILARALEHEHNKICRLECVLSFSPLMNTNAHGQIEALQHWRSRRTNLGLRRDAPKQQAPSTKVRCRCCGTQR